MIWLLSNSLLLLSNSEIFQVKTVHKVKAYRRKLMEISKKLTLLSRCNIEVMGAEQLTKICC